MVGAWVLLALLFDCDLALSAGKSVDQLAFERINNALFPASQNAALYRTIKTMLPMFDGVELYTVAFVPILTSRKKFDTVLIRTPYGTDGLKGEGESYVNEGFAVVMQDFRGRTRSKGTFQCWFNASTDAAATIDWVIAQEWSTKGMFAAFLLSTLSIRKTMYSLTG